ncbi:uncharacterized protein BCR38DRAFT_526396 [Pseudomassariella vexata]|uniref:FAD-binding domain-containing protein n=1 Tax=Pseudomassariella vexata TaxID=1141098 RepID=A0A1Y2DQC4_9PEZI|nr:uncharacterized protein BCR38DRAFT_526396 [Pseudomassariella vexata]ORY60855.1 hypothetical protein BCR38DRAFT_526396 [Pseudomassariella vexata]
MTNPAPAPFNIAIIGAGVIGLKLALALLKRNIPTTIYEQAGPRREIGAGLAFMPPCVEYMHELDPLIAETFNKVRVLGEGKIQFVNGRSYYGKSRSGGDGDGAGENQGSHDDFELGSGGLPACLRAQLVTALEGLLPEGVLKLGKRVEEIVTPEREGDNDEKIVLRFADGTTAEADAVVGCDGIKSRIRELVLSPNDPAAYPGYTHMSVYRGLIPMGRAMTAIGDSAGRGLVMELGPGSHIVRYPIAGGTLLNFLAFLSNPGEWEGDKIKMTAPASKSDVVLAFAEWGESVRALVELLPEKLDCWGMFDTAEHPLECYAYGRVCLAGDAAHASSTHHAAGVTLGIEDSLALAVILESAASKLQSPENTNSRQKVLAAAFLAYDAVRRERSQWVVQSSRHLGELYHWEDPVIGNDSVKMKEDLAWRYEKVTEFDWKKMQADAVRDFEERLERNS